MRVHLMAQEAAEIRLRAERKAGEVLILMEVKGDRSGKGDRINVTTCYIYSDFDITQMQSSRWQEIARVPEELTIQSRNARAPLARAATPHPMPA
jgi:hypothetical protein